MLDNCIQYQYDQHKFTPVRKYTSKLIADFSKMLLQIHVASLYTGCLKKFAIIRGTVHCCFAV